MLPESVVDAVVMDELGRFDEWKAMLTALANQLDDWQYRAKRAARHKDGDGG